MCQNEKVVAESMSKIMRTLMLKPKLGSYAKTASEGKSFPRKGL